jgi:hypothetical protein
VVARSSSMICPNVDASWQREALSGATRPGLAAFKPDSPFVSLLSLSYDGSSPSAAYAIDTIEVFVALHPHSSRDNSRVQLSTNVEMTAPGAYGSTRPCKSFNNGPTATVWIDIHVLSGTNEY